MALRRLGRFLPYCRHSYHHHHHHGQQQQLLPLKKHEPHYQIEQRFISSNSSSNSYSNISSSCNNAIVIPNVIHRRFDTNTDAQQAAEDNPHCHRHYFCCRATIKPPITSSLRNILRGELQERRQLQQQQQHPLNYMKHDAKKCWFSTKSKHYSSSSSSSSSFHQNHHHHKHNNNIRQYLSLEYFPLGSFDLNIAAKLVITAETLVENGSPQDIVLAFRLLRRLLQEEEAAAAASSNISGGDGSDGGLDSEASETYTHLLGGDSLDYSTTTATTTIGRRSLYRDSIIPTNVVPKAVAAWGVWFQHGMIRDDGGDNDNNSVNDDDNNNNNNVSSITMSPRNVFETLAYWESTFMTLQRTVAPYHTIIHAAASRNDPVLAEDVLDYLLLQAEPSSSLYSSGQTPNNTISSLATTVTFNSVIDAWVNSGHNDAALRAEAVLKKMIDFYNYCHAINDGDNNYGNNDGGWVIPASAMNNNNAAPDVQSYSSVITAWTNSSNNPTNDEYYAPYRAEALLRDMQGRGLEPNRGAYINVLTAWSKCNNDTIVEAPDRARAILEEMITLYQAQEQQQQQQQEQEQQQGLTDNKFKPNGHCYLAVISAYANRGNAKEAEQVLLDQCTRFQATNDPDFLPSIAGFSAVINAWSKANNNNKKDNSRPQPQQQQQQQQQQFTDEAPERAEAVLLLMQDFAVALQQWSLLPNAVLYASVLSSWARSNDRLNAPERCEQLLKKMQDNYEEFGHHDRPQDKDKQDAAAHNNPASLSCQPSTISFSIVLDCWAKSLRPEAPERAETILRQMQQLHVDHGNDMVKPDMVSYSTVMNAWALSSHPDAAIRTQALFDELQEAYYESTNNKDEDLKPDVNVYRTLITAWGRSGSGGAGAGDDENDGAANKAQAVFDDMMSRYQSGDEDLRPDVSVYTSLMGAWVKAGNVERAEEILRDMNSLSTVKADAAPYRMLMKAWSQSGVPDAAVRVQGVFDELQKKYETDGDFKMKPDLRMYATLLSTWSQSDRKDSATRAQAVFNNMMSRYQAGHNDLQPDFAIYNTLMGAWIKAGNPNQAEQVLRAMESDTTAKAQPDIGLYLSVMNAWARSGLPDSANRAQGLFDELCQRYQNGGDQHLKPNLHAYATLISAWGRSKSSRDSAAKAQAAFDDMMSRYRMGDEHLQPNAIVYGALLDAWAKAGNPERAEQILREMNSDTTTTVKPGTSSYNAVMNAWSQSNFPDAANRAQALFDELQNKYEAGEQNMKPDLHSYGTLITAWGRSKHKDGAAKAQAVFDDMLSRLQSGDKDLQPNGVICNALTDAWAKAGDPAKAEKVLRAMSMNQVKPDTRSFNSVMNAWSRSGLPNGPNRAQALFDEMRQKYAAGDQESKPTLHTYSTLITAWSRSRDKGSASKAQAVFNDMLSRYRSGEKDLKPDVVIYTAVINAWARAGMPERAEQILRDMDSNRSVGVKPDVMTYHSVMNGWCRSKEPNAVHRMQALYDEMMAKHRNGDRRVKPSEQVFDMLLSTWCGRSGKVGLWKGQAVFKDLESRYLSGDADLKQLVEKFRAPVNARSKSSR